MPSIRRAQSEPRRLPPLTSANLYNKAYAAGERLQGLALASAEAYELRCTCVILLGCTQRVQMQAAAHIAQKMGAVFLLWELLIGMQLGAAGY